MSIWRVADAKARLSEVLDKAEREGPQVVRRRGEEFVILTRLEYQKRVTGINDIDEDGKTSGDRLWHELRAVPADGIDVELETPRWNAPKVDL